MTSQTAITHLLEKTVALHRAGRLAEAEAGYRAVLNAQPKNADALNLLGVLLHSRGELGSADISLSSAIKAAPKFATAYFNRGRLKADQGLSDAAFKDYRKAIDLDPAYGDARLNLGVLFFEAGDLDAAVITFRLMTQKCPGDKRGFYNFGRSLAAVKRWGDAEVAYQKALHIDSQYTDAIVMLAKLYADTHQTDRAVETVRRAIALEPKNALALTNLGTYLSQRDQFVEAINAFDQALLIQPNDKSAIVNRGLVSLAYGDLASGWDGYAQRAETDGEFKFARPTFPWPAWHGEDLKSKKLLVWGEQGLGDEILYSSMLPDVCLRAGAVTFACSTRLLSLFRRSFPQASIVSHDSLAALKATDVFDYHTSVLDLGRWCRRSFAAFPNRRAFLVPDDNAVSAARRFYKNSVGQSQRLVGFSWRSLAPHIGAQKTPGVDFWAALFKVPHSTIIDLQYGAAKELVDDRAKFEQTFGVSPMNMEQTFANADLDHLAPHIAALDLVVTVSNTTAHLSAALGVPTIVVVPSGKGRLWYWFLQGGFSPWYPTLRIARNINEFRYLCGLEQTSAL